MLAKIIYFNWYKGDAAGLMRPTFTGELLHDRPDLYDMVGEIDVEPTEDGCDDAFRAFNRVEEDDMKGMEIRSMSVGDIVLFDNGKMFVVQGMGWKAIDNVLPLPVGPGVDKLAFWARPKVARQGY